MDKKLLSKGRLILAAGLLLLGAVFLSGGPPESASFSAQEPAMATAQNPISHPDGPTRYALFAAG